MNTVRRKRVGLQGSVWEEQEKRARIEEAAILGASEVHFDRTAFDNVCEEVTP